MGVFSVKQLQGYIDEAMKFEDNPDSGYDNTEALLVVVPMKDLHIDPLEIAAT